MLNKKQYVYTLLIAIMIFFVLFIVTYHYTKNHSWVQPSETQRSMNQVNESMVTIPIEQKATILPQTRIVLRTQDLRTRKQDETQLEASTLLGMTEEALQEQFTGYTIEAFNEKEVSLVKQFRSEVEEEDGSTYVLGVEGNYVCIKEKDSMKRPVKIDYEIYHFSKYIYSLLLNEEIVITSAQKEALLLNPSTLQKILQGYTGE